MALGSAIGKPIRVDSNTLDAKRDVTREFAVQIDLDKPVVGKVWLKGFWYKVEYEGLHRICATCGCFGHLARNCGNSPNAPQGNHDPAMTPAAPGNQPAPTQPGHTLRTADPSALMGARNQAVTTTNLVQINDDRDVTVNANHDGNQLHGDWLVVKRKSRNKTARNPIANKQNISKTGQLPRDLNRREKDNLHSNLRHKHTGAHGGNKSVTRDTVGITKSRNKRPRRDNVPTPKTNSTTGKQFVMGPSGTEKITTIAGTSRLPDVKVIYVANAGAKSTGPIYAAPSNRYTFLIDKDDENPEIMHGGPFDNHNKDILEDMVHEIPVEAQPAPT